MRFDPARAQRTDCLWVVRRNMAAGYPGLNYDLVTMDKTMMVSGDPKKVVEAIVKAID